MTLAFDQHGGALATGSRDNTVKIWEPHSGELLCSIKEAGRTEVGHRPGVRRAGPDIGHRDFDHCDALGRAQRAAAPHATKPLGASVVCCGRSFGKYASQRWYRRHGETLGVAERQAPARDGRAHRVHRRCRFFTGRACAGVAVRRSKRFACGAVKHGRRSRSSHRRCTTGPGVPASLFIPRCRCWQPLARGARLLQKPRADPAVGTGLRHSAGCAASGGGGRARGSPHYRQYVLVGDHSVGKSALGFRLIHGRFESRSRRTVSSSGCFRSRQPRSDGTECEAVLWDLAGQPDYRLVHALFLDDADWRSSSSTRRAR